MCSRVVLVGTQIQSTQASGCDRHRRRQPEEEAEKTCFIRRFPTCCCDLRPVHQRATESCHSHTKCHPLLPFFRRGAGGMTSSGKFNACDPKKRGNLTCATQNRSAPHFPRNDKKYPSASKHQNGTKSCWFVLRRKNTHVVDVSLLGGRKHPEEGLRGFPRCWS